MPLASFFNKSSPALVGGLTAAKRSGKRGWLLAAQLVLVVLLATLSYMGWRHLYPAVAETGWRYTVLLDGIEKVSAIALEELAPAFITDFELFLKTERTGF